MAEVKLTQENFESEVLGADIPVLVDFYADWCGPCKMLSPIVAQIAQENEGKIKVGKVNVDDEPSLAVAFQIDSIPALMVFKGGKLTARSVGYRNKDDILSMIGK